MPRYHVVQGGGLDEKRFPEALVFEHSFPSLWCCFNEVTESLGGGDLEEVWYWAGFGSLSP